MAVVLSRLLTTEHLDASGLRALCGASNTKPEAAYKDDPETGLLN
jgi:hypothetical protein